MGLIGKEPIQKPCEADSFEEAALKNRLRLNHERNLCVELFEEMKAKGEAGHEAMHPAFWTGAVSANEAAFGAYQMEFTSFLRRVSARLESIKDHPNVAEAEKTGWKEVLENWKNAIEKNNPSIIVYW